MTNLYSMKPSPRIPRRSIPAKFMSLLRAGAVALLLTGAAELAAQPAGFEIVSQRAPKAVVVIPDQAKATVKYAAEELVYHVEKATGVKLPVVAESDVKPSERTRIYLGETRAARAAGIEPARLPVETSVLRTSAGTLFIAGRDASDAPLATTPPFGAFNASAGTLFGVYEWLERDLGVRWLWPGELGTFVPKRETLAVSSFDETFAPRMFQRNVRPGSFPLENPALGFTPKAREEYQREQSVFLRRNRMGRGQQLGYGHAFTDWWEKYGAEHPEWFQLVKGKRGPVKPGDRFSMCVSDPGLHRKIVDLWLAKGKGTAESLPPSINVVENDFLGSCECEHCRAWDGPEPADAMKFYAPNFKVYGTRFTSDRYARFALAVQQLAAVHRPDVKVVGYVYFNYFQAPTSGVKLNKNIVLGFCPSAGWYPRLDDEDQWYRAQWQGWQDTGATVFARTNYFLDGYAMPFIFAHQFAKDFQYMAQHGLAATDFDSLTGQWATQGTTLYLLMRLHTHPDAKVEDLLAEYYAGFGPAAAAVKAYFDHYEDYTMNNRKMVMDIFYDRVALRWRSWAKATHRVFPPESFLEGERLLAKAAEAAAGDAESLARVKFLQVGLAHAKLCAAASAQLTTADPASTPERGKAALEELLRFRRAHEREWFGNLAHSAWVEEVSWKLSQETKQEPEYYP